MRFYIMRISIYVWQYCAIVDRWYDEKVSTKILLLWKIKSSLIIESFMCLFNKT